MIEMKELLEWLKEYRLNTMSLMRIGDYEQGQIDVLTDVINRVDPNRCSYCGKGGFHKLSCTNNTERVVIPMSYIPTLEGDEAEEFIRKAEQNVKDMRQRIIDKAKELQERYDNDYLKMQELISKEANFVTEKDIKRMRRCKNHVWRKDFLNGGKKCQVCGKAKEEPTRAKDVEP